MENADKGRTYTPNTSAVEIPFLFLVEPSLNYPGFPSFTRMETGNDLVTERWLRLASIGLFACPGIKPIADISG